MVDGSLSPLKVLLEFYAIYVGEIDAVLLLGCVEFSLPSPSPRIFVLFPFNSAFCSRMIQHGRKRYLQPAIRSKRTASYTFLPRNTVSGKLPRGLLQTRFRSSECDDGNRLGQRYLRYHYDEASRHLSTSWHPGLGPISSSGSYRRIEYSTNSSQLLHNAQVYNEQG